MARIQMSSDVSHVGWNKYGAGGGASPFSTWYENLLVSNTDTSVIGQTLDGAAADFTMVGGMPTVAPGKVWNIFVNGTVDWFNVNVFEVGTTLSFRITDSNGDYWVSTPVTISSTGSHSLREQWVDDTYQLDCTGTPTGTGDTPNQCRLIVHSDNGSPGAYCAFTYFAIEIANYTVTVSSDAHSAWDHEGANSVAPAGSFSTILTPDANYEVADVLLDTVSVGDAAGDATYTESLTNVSASHTISGTARLSPVVTVSSDAHSAWDQEGAIVKRTGTNLTITLTPAATYRIVDVLVDDVSVGDAVGEDTYELTLTNITADMTVSATVAVPASTDTGVTVVNAGGSGGSVVADIPDAVEGQTVRYTISPAFGQRITVFSVDGVSQRDTADPLAGGAHYSVAMDAGEPIEYDYILPPSPAVYAEFNRNAGQATTSYDAGLATGFGAESFAKRAATQAADLRQRALDNRQF